MFTFYRSSSYWSCWFIHLLRILHVTDSGQNYGGRKSDTVRGTNDHPQSVATPSHVRSGTRPVRSENESLVGIFVQKLSCSLCCGESFFFEYYPYKATGFIWFIWFHDNIFYANSVL